MNNPASDDVRRALASLRQAGRGLEQIHEDERPGGAPPWTRQTFERAADDATKGECQAGDRLAGLVESLAGSAPCALIVDGEIIVIGADADGMAIVPAGRVVTL
jgi:hypothetical protein